MTIQFSMVVPVYNRAGYVSQAIDSILCQLSPNDEVLVVDDGSTDDTPRMLEAYESRIKVIRQKNQGPEVARNTGAAQAQGEYLVFLDSDDLLLPRALSVYRQIIRTLNAPPLILGAMAHFRDGNPLPPGENLPGPVVILRYRDYLSKDVPFHMTNSRIVIKRSVFVEAGGFRDTTPTTFYMDDFDLLLRLGTVGPCVLIRKPFTVGYREHTNNCHLDVSGMAQGILGLAHSERSGRYPGGKDRRWARYACIGGVSASFAIRHCWNHGYRAQALRLLGGPAFMIVTAAWARFRRRFRQPTPSIVLPHNSGDAGGASVSAA